MLQLESVQRSFGGVRAVDGVSLQVADGEIHGLIGPNGAGKTTLLNLITGFVPLESGTVQLDTDQLSGRSPHRVAALGVARTFQNLRLFREMTALENVLVGMHQRRRHDLLQQLAMLPVLRSGQQSRVAEARQLLARAGLQDDVADRRAGTLAYGDQRRLEIARALAARPRLLLLDEPAAGMNPAEKDAMRELIQGLSAEGLTILLIDHDMRLVMSVCDSITVLNFGRVIGEGKPAEVARDPAVIEAYLGTGEAVTKPEAAAREVANGVRRTVLEVSGLTVAYGPIEAVKGVDFAVAEGELVTLVGANGAGKSTILNTLSGLLRPRLGTATFEGLELTRANPSRIVRHGLVQVPEGREILARLTVQENLELAGWGRRGSIAGDLKRVHELFPILLERRSMVAGQLSGGEQQMLAIGRGLIARPRLLLLDEPSLGLAPKMADTVFEAIAEVHAAGTTVLLVEQNAQRALELADRGYVIEAGQVTLSGPGRELLGNPAIREAYLGG